MLPPPLAHPWEEREGPGRPRTLPDSRRPILAFDFRSYLTAQTFPATWFPSAAGRRRGRLLGTGKSTGDQAEKVALEAWGRRKGGPSTDLAEVSPGRLPESEISGSHLRPSALSPSPNPSYDLGKRSGGRPRCSRTPGEPGQSAAHGGRRRASLESGRGGPAESPSGPGRRRRCGRGAGVWAPGTKRLRRGAPGRAVQCGERRFAGVNVGSCSRRAGRRTVCRAPARPPRVCVCGARVCARV